MKQNKKTALFLIIFLVVIILLMVISIFTSRIKMNPPGTIGNTAGNLNNKGYFCEYNGTVYFVNPYDGSSLYSMSPSEDKLKKLNSLKIHNILAGGSYLYFFQTGSNGTSGLGSIRSTQSFIRSKLDGSGSTGLLRETVMSGQLVDNYLYLLVAGDKNLEFQKMKIDKKDKVKLADFSINPSCAVPGKIYYSGTVEDHYLYSLDTATDSISQVWPGNVWYPVAEGDYIYYMDVDNNYRLCRYSLSQDIVEILTEDRVDCFNVGSGYIYYMKNSETEPQLKSMTTDGQNVTVIAEGNYTNINMTSRYVYFQAFGDEFNIYHLPLGGSQYSIFEAARDAALAR